MKNSKAKHSQTVHGRKGRGSAPSLPMGIVWGAAAFFTLGAVCIFLTTVMSLSQADPDGFSRIPALASLYIASLSGGAAAMHTLGDSRGFIASGALALAISAVMLVVQLSAGSGRAPIFTALIYIGVPLSCLLGAALKMKITERGLRRHRRRT